MGLFDFIEHLRSGRMDFAGQRKAYLFMMVTMWLSGMIGFIYGLITSNFSNTFKVVFAAGCINMLLVVPSWPIWNRNPVSFCARKSD